MTIDESNFKVPVKSAGDHGYAAIKAAISTIPIVGGSAVELFNAILTPPLERRRNEWMTSVSAALLALDREKRIDLASLAGNPQFIDAVLLATRIALQTSRAEKLKALRYAVRNIALTRESDSYLHEILLHMIDGLTEIHLQFLSKFCRSAGSTSTTSTDGFAWSFPALQESPLLYGVVWKELRDKGLLEGTDHEPTGITGILTVRATPLGLQLLSLIAEPSKSK